MNGLMKRPLILVVLGLLAAAPAFGADTWHGLVSRMESTLQEALRAFRANDPEKARDKVNETYFSYYEKEGMERAVQSSISSRRASVVEYQFTTLKKVFLTKQPLATVEAETQKLLQYLREDATILDGKTFSAAGVFLSSFLILFREGAEAILVLAAIIAFLVKSGNGQRRRAVYLGAAAAVVASLITAWALHDLLRLSGSGREALEGVTMLAAVAVLFFVSHWMLGKAESRHWQRYIDGKVKASVGRGGIWALGLACFLAVYREGAETVLFYQALVLDSGPHLNFVWMGLGAGTVALAVLFAVARFGSVRLPLKPFFLVTGFLMYFLSIVFIGGGVKELQEVDWIAATPLAGMPSFDLLGLYPTLETLTAQAVLILAAVVSIPFYRRRSASVPKN